MGQVKGEHNMSTGRLQEINTESIYLYAEIKSVQERALLLVEALENDFDLTGVSPELHERFLTMQRLLTRV